jgi:hypothetical protein
MGVFLRSPSRLLVAAAVLASAIAFPAAIRADQLVGDLEARIRPASGDVALPVALRPAGTPAVLAYRSQPVRLPTTTWRGRPASSLPPLQVLALVLLINPASLHPDPTPPVSIATYTPPPITTPPSVSIPLTPPHQPPDNPPPVHIASTPEPASLVSALLGCSLTGLAVLRRRRPQQ